MSLPRSLPLLPFLLLGTLAATAAPIPVLDQPPVSFEVIVEPPSYNPDNPNHRLIESNEDWKSINDPAYRAFFVAPGDYRDAGEILLTASGTASVKRWILAYDPDAPFDSTHPWHQPPEKRAFVDSLRFDRAAHWIVDRIRINKGSRLTNRSNHNVLNRLMIYEMDLANERTSIGLFSDSNYNTVQNCVIAKTPPTPTKDAAGVYISNADYNRVLKNEIFDIPGDCVQTGQNRAHARGTIIQDNDFYLTPAYYTDGNGNFTPDGDFAASENGIDIKAHWQPDEEIAPENRWMILENNRIWGFRPTDPKAAGTGSGGDGIVIHYRTSSGVRVRHNVIWNSPAGIVVSKNEQRGPISHHEVHDNLIWDVDIGLKPRHIDDSLYFRNILVDVRNWLWLTDTALKNTITVNVLINAQVYDTSHPLFQEGAMFDHAGAGTEVRKNAYYGSAWHQPPGKDDIVGASSEDAFHVGREILIKRITAPETIVIPHGQATDKSPHADWLR